MKRIYRIVPALLIALGIVSLGLFIKSGIDNFPDFDNGTPKSKFRVK